MRASELVQRFDLQPTSPFEDFEVRAIRPLDEAEEGDVSFLHNPRYRDEVARTRASAILLKAPIEGCRALQWLCKDPYFAFAKILSLFHPEPERPPRIHPSAVIEPGAVLDPTCHVGPFCHVANGAELAAGVVLEAHVHVGAGSRIGAESRIFPNVVIYHGCEIGKRVRIHANTTIGSDGFGYAFHAGAHHKIPQVGGVRIGDDVEIGSNVSIDRGALKDTQIGDGCKIDNQVQIAHGVSLGKHVILVSQTGISGSASIGDYSVLAGKVGVVGHVRIGEKITVLGDSVVTKNLEKPGMYAGNPAVPHIQYQRRIAMVNRLGEYVERIKALENRAKEEPDRA